MLKSECVQIGASMNQNTDKKPKKALRVSEIVSPDGMLPISKSSWWAGVKSGIYPAPIKLGPGITAWRLEEIEALLERGI